MAIAAACTLSPTPATHAAGTNSQPVGQVVAFGAGDTGQLGNGSTTDSSVPTTVSGLTGAAPLREVTAVAVGADTGYAITATGELLAWGDNADGQVGDGTTFQADTPVQVESNGGSGILGGVSAVGGGYEDALALLSDGSLRAWGDNQAGELGNGTTAAESMPTPVLGLGGTGELSGVSAIAVGGFHDAALMTGGTVLAWGSNQYGQLGDGGTTNASAPTSVSGTSGGDLFGVSAISSGVFHSLALLNNGTVVSWGQSHIGQLGNASTSQSSIPVVVDGVGGSGYLGNVIAIATGGYHNLALLKDGTVVSWGTDADGELGDAGAMTSNGCGCATTPVLVQGLSHVTQIAAGQFSSYAVESDGSLWSWGDDSNGELGDGDETDTNLPHRVPNVSALSVVSGTYASFALALEPEPAVNTVAPSVTGSGGGAFPAVGSVLTTTTGTWTGTAPISYTYQWQRCGQSCQNISGATADQYVVTTNEDAQRLRVAVSATNPAGTATVDSAETAAVPATAAASAGATALTTTALAPSISTSTRPPTVASTRPPPATSAAAASPAGLRHRSGSAAEPGPSRHPRGAASNLGLSQATGASAGALGSRTNSILGLPHSARSRPRRRSGVPAPRAHGGGNSPGGRGPRSQPQHAAHRNGFDGHTRNPRRSLIAAALTRPDQLHLSARDLERSLGIAVLLVALLGLPATLFNRTVQKNRTTIGEWIGPVRRLVSAPHSTLAKRLLGLTLTSVLAGTIVEVFLEPGFPSRPGSLEYAVGMFLGLAAYALNKGIHRRVFYVRGKGEFPETEAVGGWSVYPEQILVSVLFVSLSRLGHFVPGMMLGKQGDYDNSSLDTVRKGQLVFRTHLSQGVISLAAWFISIPVGIAATRTGAGDVTLVADTGLTVLAVMGIETTVFELVPLYFMPGEELRRWSPRRWAVLWSVGILWFALVVVNPALSDYRGEANASLVWLIVLFGLEASISVALWAFFAVRLRRQDRERREQGSGGINELTGPSATAPTPEPTPALLSSAAAEPELSEPGHPEAEGAESRTSASASASAE